MEILVNDLLDTSLITTGMFALHPTRCDVVELCQSLIQEFLASTIQTPTISFAGPDKAVEAEIDVDRVSQVILNLFANALKYSPEGAPITIKVESAEKECGIAIRDVGVGIPPELLPHIFERFYRVPGIQTQTGSGIGLGLGLYISHKIVERHGGRIDVHSIPGAGSTFTIVLPLSPALVTSDGSSTTGASHSS